MATTYNYTDGSIQGRGVLPLPVEYEKITPVKGVVDFSQQALDAGEGDIAQAINIPAKTTVLTVTALPLTDSDDSLPPTNATVDVGYAGNDQWGDGINIASAAYGTTIFLPYYFAAADTIDITATTDTADVDIDSGRVEVIAYCIRHR